MLVAAAARSLTAVGAGVSVAAAIAPGLMVMALIFSLADVCGAHFNPAVTFAFALRRAFPWRRGLGYVAAQFAGAVIASVALLALFGSASALGATTPARTSRRQQRS